MATSNIRMPDGREENPVYLSCANVTRLGDEQYACVLSWIEGERSKRAEQAAAREEDQREMAATFRKDAELRHPKQAAWAQKNL
jgi:hypothetical protein